MSDEKPLPNPRRRFGGQAGQEQNLLADRMAMAMAEGRLDEFVEQEFKGNENAVKLAEMMMQMTGMAPPGVQGKEAAPPKESPQKKPRAKERPQAPHEKPPVKEPTGEGETGPVTALERDMLDQLTRIANENGVSVDWIISRAILLYIRDYVKTGRL